MNDYSLTYAGPKMHDDEINTLHPGLRKIFNDKHEPYRLALYINGINTSIWVDATHPLFSKSYKWEYNLLSNGSSIRGVYHSPTELVNKLENFLVNKCDGETKCVIGKETYLLQELFDNSLTKVAR